MREFFRGWRRKAGCALLVMACVTMWMWVRSRRIGESVDFILAGEHHFLLSSNGQIAWEAYPSYPNARTPWYWCYNRFPKNRNPHFTIEESRILKLDKNFVAPGDRVLDYRSATYCLTLLSAYLLLWKPRKRLGADHA